MEKHYDITNINWNDLRNQKLELLKAITERNLTDDPLEGIVSLIDSLQDFVVDDLGYNPNEVYLLEEPDPDFPCDPLSELVVTEEAKAIVQDIMTNAIYSTPNKKILIKTVFLCKCCQSDNVDVRKWVNPNTDAVGSDCDETLGYCNDCGLPTTVYCSDLKASAKVIGFQVVSDDEHGDIHPDMDASFCVYNLEQAQGMIEKGCNNRQQQWNLLTIWDGDIEEPTMMFEGNPRDTEMG
jgi:hypothetical protein